MESKKIKILFVTPWLFVGGAERTFIDLITRLDSERFEAKLLIMDDSGAEGSIWRSELEAKHIEVISIARKKIASLGKLGGALKALRLMAALYRVFRTERPDIVHTQLFADLYGRIIARLAGVRIIVSSENNVNVDEPRWQTMIKRWTAGIPKQIVAISKAVGEDALARYGLTQKQVTVIPTGIDFEKYYIEAQFRLDRKQVCRFGAMGRLSEQKGFTTLLQALSLIKDKDFECQIAGDGELRADLETEIKRLGLTDKVRLVGIQKDVKSFFAQLDIFVMPSWWEGLGLVVLEAGAAGLPVIASNVDGLREIIVDGKTGVLVSPRNEIELAQALAYGLAHYDDPRWLALGTALQSYVKTAFSLDLKTAAYEKLYTELMAA